jgi:adenosylhomocysteinase
MTSPGSPGARADARRERAGGQQAPAAESSDATLPGHSIADLALAPAGEARIEWADAQMPVLRRIRERFAGERPLQGYRVAACLHVTAETANLVRTLQAGGAEVSLCSANPLSTQDDVAAALVVSHGVEVRAIRGEDLDAYVEHVRALLAGRPQITIDDGADLLVTAHAAAGDALTALIGGTEETTTGLVRLRRLQDAGELTCPVLAVNEARTERALNDRHGTGQSALDGIVRASNVLLAGHTLVVLGYGWAGQGVAERARGAGAAVIVCEIDPLRALEARMAGYQVMPALDAAERGDIFVTVTGSRRVLRGIHFERMKDGAVLANAGHFDVEIDLEELRAAAGGPGRAVRPLVEQFDVGGRRLNLLAHGRVVNLAAAEGHPAAVMDVSFALQALCVEELVRRQPALPPGVHAVPAAIDEEVGRLKLAALGVRIDEPTAEQADYRESWL